MPSKCLLPAFFLFFSAAASLCAVAGERTLATRSNNASTVLIETASQQYAQGKLDQAAATLERALQIQPNNPATLHYLGVLRLQQGQYQQAQTLAARSNLRVGGNGALRSRNLQLIQAARQAQITGATPTAEKVADTVTTQAVAQDMPIVPAVREVAKQRPLDAAEQAIGYNDIDIPRGHRPPKGKCRIWFPDRPPGHQPASGNCKKLQDRVPDGAFLVRH